MSDFFKNYSTFYYNMDKVKPIRGKLATNLLSRVNITNEVLKNVRSYYPYRIKEHERPDIIAQEIGYKRLEKINKRGEELTEKLIAEYQAGQQQQPQPQIKAPFEQAPKKTAFKEAKQSFS